MDEKEEINIYVDQLREGARNGKIIFLLRFTFKDFGVAFSVVSSGNLDVVYLVSILLHVQGVDSFISDELIKQADKRSNASLSTEEEEPFSVRIFVRRRIHFYALTTGLN